MNQNEEQCKVSLASYEKGFSEIINIRDFYQKPINFLLMISILVKDQSLYMTGQLIQLAFNDVEDLLTRLKGNNDLNN